VKTLIRIAEEAETRAARRRGRRARESWRRARRRGATEVSSLVDSTSLQ